MYAKAWDSSAANYTKNWAVDYTKTFSGDSWVKAYTGHVFFVDDDANQYVGAEGTYTAGIAYQGPSYPYERLYAGNLSTYEKVYAKAWDSSAANYTKAYIGPVAGARAFTGTASYTASISFISSGLKVPYMRILPYEGSFTGTYTRLYSKTYTKLWNAYAQDYTKQYEGSWTGTYSRTFYGPSDDYLVMNGTDASGTDANDNLILEDSLDNGKILMTSTSDFTGDEGLETAFNKAFLGQYSGATGNVPQYDRAYAQSNSQFGGTFGGYSGTVSTDDLTGRDILLEDGGGYGDGKIILDGTDSSSTNAGSGVVLEDSLADVPTRSEFFSKEWQGTYTKAWEAAYEKAWLGPRTYVNATGSAYSGKNYQKDYLGTYQDALSYTQLWGGGFTKAYEGGSFARESVVTYNPSYIATYEGSFVNEWSGYSKTYEKVWVGEYSKDYTKAWTKTWESATGAYLGDTYTKVYTATYTKAWSKDYEADFSGDYNGSSKVNYEKTYTASYDKDYVGTYEKAYLSTFDADYVKTYTKHWEASFEAESGDYIGLFAADYNKTYTKSWDGIAYIKSYDGATYTTVSYTHLTLPTICSV